MVPSDAQVGGGFSRRNFLGLALASGAALTLGDLAGLLGLEPAQAIAWSYPFTQYYSNDSDFYSISSSWYPYPGQHKALDFSAPRGKDVYACASGTITQSYYNTINALGNIVVIEHVSGLSTLYAHLREPGLPVGTTISAPTVIGHVGDTGGDYPNHLHVEMWSPDRANRIDPAPFIQHPPAPLAGSPWPGMSATMKGLMENMMIIYMKDVAAHYGPANGEYYTLVSDSWRLPITRMLFAADLNKVFGFPVPGGFSAFSLTYAEWEAFMGLPVLTAPATIPPQTVTS